MRILLTGKFDPEYNRTKIIIKGLEDLGVELKIMPYTRKYKLNKKELRMETEKADWIFLPSFTHTDVPFIRKMTAKPIIFDPLISRYLSKVFDYKAVSRYSPRAYKNFLKDSRSLLRSDIILADTFCHKKYYEEKFSVNPGKIKVLPIGVITKDFYPLQEKPDNLENITVGFYGSFIPLHGIDIIIEAAKELSRYRNINFRILGNGILFREMKDLAEKQKLNNIEFPGYVRYPKLNYEINNFDIALGIFGSSLKASMVIPNKLFHYAACQVPVISMESDAVKEIFSHNENIHLCSPSPASLAEAILKLQNKDYRKKIARNAGKLIRENYNEKRIGKMFMDILT
ncbi:MAG: glycosyltransferase, partial [Bacteroidota bacterium]